MFLFKKKKDSPEVTTEEQKSEVKKTAPPVKVVDKNAKKASEEKAAKESPVSVTVKETSGAKNQGKNPDEIADGLLVKVTPDPDIENAVSDAQVKEVLKPVVAVEAAAVNKAQAAPVKTADSASTANAKPENSGTGPAAASVAGDKNKGSDVPKTGTETKAAEKTEAKPAESKPAAAEKKAGEENKKPEGEKKPDEAKKGGEGEDKGNLFSNLFGKADVEEETALDRLIKSLPDIAIEEVVNEADEVKSLMSEWYQNQPKP
jgi:hypothetical protein